MAYLDSGAAFFITCKPSTQQTVLCRGCPCLSVLSIFMRFLFHCCYCWLLSMAELAVVVCALVYVDRFVHACFVLRLRGGGACGLLGGLTSSCLFNL